MKVNVKVTVSRASNDRVYIRVEDETSRIEFLDVGMTLEDFGSLITGLAYRPASGEVRNLENVGKVLKREQRTAEYPGTEYNKEIIRAWLLESHQEPGWTIDSYLGSQTSIVPNNGRVLVNYAVFRFVEKMP